MRSAFVSALLLPSLVAVSAASSAQVFLHPAPDTGAQRPSLSPSQAHAVLSHHLGIDRWIELNKGGEWLDVFLRSSEDQDVMGPGEEGGVMVVVETDHPEDFLSGQSPSFTISSPPSFSTFQSLAQTYAARLSTLSSKPFNATSIPTSEPDRLLDSFDLSDSPAVAQFRQDVEQLMHYADWVEDGGSPGGACALGGLDGIDRESEEYHDAVRLLYAALNVPALSHHKLAVITVPPSSSMLSSRASLSPASVCFASNDTCASATSNCSGHGACVSSTRAGRTCFVCKCGKSLGATGRNETWAGAMCEKVDISGSFSLLIGSTVFLIVIAIGSVMLLYGVGTHALPSTLIGAAPSLGKKD